MAAAMTPYEKLLEDLEKNMKFQTEIDLGKRIGLYKVHHELGVGAFAKVKLGAHCLINSKVAIKIVSKELLDEKTMSLLKQEIECMTELCHPNIIRLFEVMETPYHFYISTEFATSGTITDKVEKYKHFSENMAKIYYSQILSAVQYIHEKNIVHRDIKSDNIFIHGELCKLGDFGFCTVNPKEKLLETFCGSPPYAAPELFKDDFYGGRNVDIWALGVLLYFMTVGELPFTGGTLGKLKQRILAGNYAEFPKHVSAPLKNLVTDILKVNPSDRISVDEMMRCTWLEDTVFCTPMASSRVKPPLPGEEIDKIEKEALQELNTLGVKEDIIRQCPDSIKDRINGMYRLAYYKAAKKEFKQRQKIEDAKMERRAQRLADAQKRNKGNPISKLCVIM